MSVNILYVPLHIPQASMAMVVPALGMPVRKRSSAFFEDGKVCSLVMVPFLSMMQPASFSLWMSMPSLSLMAVPSILRIVLNELDLIHNSNSLESQ